MPSDLLDQLQQTLTPAYTLERELGGGGMSRVFVAEEHALGRKVVVKVLPPETAADVNVDRFKREIQLAARLQHPHIVPVLITGEIDGLPYYTMPYVEGESVRARLTKNGALPITAAVSVLRDVAKALAYAHEHGVVHRDIKPDNVLISGTSAVVTDFGIAKALADSRRDHATHLTEGLTVAGVSIGTPAYMSPEQAAADPSTDHRTDIYSFGCLAYELLAGRPPFVASSPQKMLAAHMSERSQSIKELRPETPLVLAELVMRCLEKDAERRPQTAAELVDVLESATSGTSHGGAAAALLNDTATLKTVLAIYVAAFVVVAALAKVAIVQIGLPDWVFAGAVLVMALGLPGILLTAANASPHLNWRRVTLGGAYAFGAFVLLVGIYMVLRAAGIGPAGSLLAAGTFKDRARLVVSDFAIHGNAVDSSLVTVVSEAVRSALSQSEVVSTLAPAQISGALTRMQRTPNTRLDLSLAREVAQREGAKAVVDGDITPLGAGFVVSLRLIGSDSAQELASFRETADTPRDLLPAIDKLTRALRGKIGESLRSVRSSPRLDQVTTTSLPALRAYAEASTANSLGDYAKSVKLLEEAIALDTSFAMAYRKLAVAMSNARMNPARADSMLERAYAHRDHLTDYERLMTLGTYWDDGPHYDRVKSIDAYERVTQRYPDDYGAWLNLANLYESRGDFDRADSAFRRSALAGTSTFATFNPIFLSLTRGRPDEARKRLDVARQVFPGNPRVMQAENSILYAEGKYDSAYAKFDDMKKSKAEGFRRLAPLFQSRLDLVLGRLSTAGRLMAEFSASESARGVPAPPLEGVMDSVEVDAWYLGKSADALKTLDAALARTPIASLPAHDRPYFRAMYLYALLGRPDRARGVLAEYDAEVRDTSRKRVQLHERHTALGWIALADRKPLVAVAELRHGDSLPDGPVNACPGCIGAALGRAFDAANMPDSAIAAYTSYVDRSTSAQKLFIDAWNLGPALKRLGELLEAKGDRAKAATYYQRFVDLWKNADPELQPHVAEVRRRLARLSAAAEKH